MEEPRIVEIKEDTVPVMETDTLKLSDVKAKSEIKEATKVTVVEPSAKEEMEALADNEELIRDWLDDTAQLKILS